MNTKQSESKVERRESSNPRLSILPTHFTTWRRTPAILLIFILSAALLAAFGTLAVPSAMASSLTPPSQLLNSSTSQLLNSSTRQLITSTRSTTLLPDLATIIYVNQAAPENNFVKDDCYRRGKYRILVCYHLKQAVYVSFEEAVNAAPEGATIHLCPGHYAGKGTYTKELTFKPSENASICAAGNSVLEQLPLKGYTGCAFGSQNCNRCVNNVITTFQQLDDGQKKYAFNLNGHPDPQFNLFEGMFHGHWQGVQRLNSSAKSLVVARDLIQYSGEEWSGFVIVQDDEIVQTWRVDPDLSHAGGIQMAGNYLVFPLEPETGQPPMVHVYDLSDPLDVFQVDSNANPIATRAEGNKGSWAALSQLSNKRYLLAVGRVGTPIDFYISDQPNNLKDFSFFYRWPPDGKSPNQALYYSPGKSSFKKPGWDEYQSMNLLTECGTGKLYLVGTGNRPTADTPCTDWTVIGDDLAGDFCMPVGQDWVDLYRLDLTGNTVRLTKVSEIGLKIQRASLTPGILDDLLDILYLDNVVDAIEWILQGDTGNLDAAAGTYVDRDGRLYLYTTQHGWVRSLSDGEHYTNLMEFGPKSNTGIKLSQPSVQAIPGDRAVQLVIDIGKISKDAVEFVVYSGPKKLGGYTVKGLKDIGGWIWDLTPWGDRAVGEDLPDQPAWEIGQTLYYTVTVRDSLGNESPPSEVISATWGVTHLALPDISGAPGGVAHIPIQSPNIEGVALCRADLRLEYDPAVLTPTGITNTLLAPAYPWSSQVITPGLFQVVLSTTTAETLHGSGALFDALFQVTASAGLTSTLAFSPTGMELVACDEPGAPLLLDLAGSGVFTAASVYLPGDLDGSGTVTAQDAALVQQYAVGLAALSDQQLQAGDLNSDGWLTTADAVLVMRLAGGLPLLPTQRAGLGLTISPTITLSLPEGIQIAQGGSAWFPIGIDDASRVAGLDLVLNYDPYITAFQEARLAALTSHFDLVYHERYPGQVWLSLKPTAGFETGLDNGSGTVVEVRLEDAGHSQGGALSPINLIAAALSDPFGQDFANSSLQVGILMPRSAYAVLDAEIPQVVTFTPQDGNSLVSTGEAPYIEFTEPMDADSLQVTIDPPVDLYPTWTGSGYGLYLEHDGLDPETTYTLQLMAGDLAGHALTQTLTWAFTTTVIDTTPPAVLAVSPAEGAQNVTLWPTFHITFSEAIYGPGMYLGISPAPLESPLNDFDWAAEWNLAHTVVTVTQPLTLTPGLEHTMFVVVEDRFGNVIAEPFSWSFTVIGIDFEVYLPLVVR